MAGTENLHAGQNRLLGGMGGSFATPPQALPESQKTPDWWKATINAYERIGERQLQENIRFREYRKMVEGEFTYAATGFGDFQSMPWFDKQIRKLRADRGIPTHIKHFDFIGMVCNALSGIYNEFEEIFQIDSIDEYSTNEYIRQKTELLHKYAAETFQKEINRLLLIRGVDVNKTDFGSQEEADAYKQEIENQTRALTPEEITESLAKNFKVLATEWAQHKLDEDRKEYYLHNLDQEDFVSYLLSGRYFRHFRVGYDNYTIESWAVEETFFSQDVHAKYPQDGEFVGRITNISPASIMNKFGHLLTATEQKNISNYWNQSDDWKKQAATSGTTGKNIMQKVFPEHHIVPYQDYYTNDLMNQYEDFLGEPLGLRTLKDKEGKEFQVSDWLPRAEGHSLNTNMFTKYLRDDIEVRSDTIQVTELYWMSYKRISVLTFQNSLGMTEQMLVTDDLLRDFITENDIKIKQNVSLEEFQQAIKDDNLDDYINTIVYTYGPEVWKAVKIKGNGSTIKDDLFLDVGPLPYQIKGSRSNIYDVKLPVAGIISTGIAKKMEPYQVLHNIAMNQITELTEKELGVFFTFDMMYLPAEFKDETTEDALYQMRDMIKTIGLFGMDMSKQNTEGNPALANTFQRQDITFTNQMEYRWAAAQRYKEQAFAQIGITPQLLGQPNTYATSEGVKQGTQASYALITPIFEKMNTAKAKEMEIHLAIAQWCEANGKDSTVLFRKGDGDHQFMDIMAEDGEVFPLRHLGVQPVLAGGNQRKILETIKVFIQSDNTVTRNLEDAIQIMTSKTLHQVKAAAAENRKRIEAETKQKNEFESSQLDKTLAAKDKEVQDTRTFEIEKINLENESEERQAYISGLGKAVDSNGTSDELNLYKIEASTVLGHAKLTADVGLKQQDLTQKAAATKSAEVLKLQELGLRAKEISLKEKELNSKQYIAEINKN